MSSANSNITTGIQPRVAGLKSAMLFTGLSADMGHAASALGLDASQFGHMRGGAQQAELDIPRGAWRYWPARGAAAWLGRKANVAAPQSELRAEPLELSAAIARLFERGLWSSELRLLRRNGWSSPLPLKDALAELRDARVLGVAATWSDGRGGAVHVELFSDGQVWASDALHAERWLLVANGLPDE
jgi:hypothetical protein